MLGQRIPMPFALSPIGAPRMLHHEGELAVARAVRHYGIPYGLSTLATTSVEDVAAQTATPLWFQLYVWELYVWGDRGEIKETVARAKGDRVRRAAVQHRHRRAVQTRAGKKLRRRVRRRPGRRPDS